ncbi:MAG: HAMP domain-containing histidine kinase [Alphaproteobacteria bacterium]|nr:HAMP domain-containing histidine kinase [Alphaproteobacteria bacterium]
MAQTLHAPIARNIIAAEGLDLVQLHVLATPGADHIDITIGGWTILPHMTRLFGLASDVDTSLEWRFACDAGLKITKLWGRAAPAKALGLGLDDLFRFEYDEEGNAPIFSALAKHVGFDGQVAACDDHPDKFLIAAMPCFDVQGKYCGWRGRVQTLAHPNQAPQPPGAPEYIDNIEPPQLTDLQRLGQQFRTSLELIIGEADSLVGQHEGPLDARYVEYAHDILAASRHLIALIEDVQDADIVDSPHFKAGCETIDLADATRRAASLLRVRAADARVSIEAPDVADNIFVQGDFKRLLQILINILGNAIRYSPHGATIWVRSEIHDGLAALIIADQGKGIAPELHEKIFSRFFRADPSELGGSGLGLYISRKLARAMGGDVTVESAPGQGARFILTLPVVTD